MTINPHHNAVPLVDVWRGDLLESQHRGHVVVADMEGIVKSWGDPEALVYPRSSAKMIQALPLLTTGAGNDLSTRRLALACASHQGGKIHVDEVQSWLDDIGCSEDCLLCGPQPPADRPLRDELIRQGQKPCQLHNNCSGKHAGFLTVNKHLKGDDNYVDRDHVVQKAVFDAFEEVTQENVTGYGVDGCSAPNPIASMAGVARAMAWFATAHTRSDVMSKAAATFVEAMCKHPEYVAGETRACTNLMRAMDGVAVKTGADGYFVAIIPAKGLGVAVKIADGAARGSEAAISNVLISLGVLDPAAQKYVNAPIKNWRGLEIGELRASEGFEA